MRIYTDASTPQHKSYSGIAFLITNNKDQEIFRHSTIIKEKDNNTAELAAILYALTAIKDNKRPVTLLTDSAYAIHAIRENKYREREANIVENIQLQLSRLNCKLFWIKAHSQDGTVLSYFNRLVDNEAKDVWHKYEEQKRQEKIKRTKEIREKREEQNPYPDSNKRKNKFRNSNLKFSKERD